MFAAAPAAAMVRELWHRRIFREPGYPPDGGTAATVWITHAIGDLWGYLNRYDSGSIPPSPHQNRFDRYQPDCCRALSFSYLLSPTGERLTIRNLGHPIIEVVNETPSHQLVSLTLDGRQRVLSYELRILWTEMGNRAVQASGDKFSVAYPGSLAALSAGLVDNILLATGQETNWGMFLKGDLVSLRETY